MIDVMHHISPAQSFQYIYPQLKHFCEKFFTAFYVLNIFERAEHGKFGKIFVNKKKTQKTRLILHLLNKRILK